MNPFDRKFPGYRIGRFRWWPWVGFWNVSMFRIGTTRVYCLGFSRLFVEERRWTS